jgi:DNA-binding FrmR family transcriptional regulator
MTVHLYTFIVQISALTSANQQELQKVLAAHAAEHSTSKVAELSSKISTQEVVFCVIQRYSAMLSAVCRLFS